MRTNILLKKDNDRKARVIRFIQFNNINTREGNHIESHMTSRVSRGLHL